MADAAGVVMRWIAATGAALIRAWVILFGKRCDPRSLPWIAGPVGGPSLEMGPLAYRDIAANQGWTVDEQQSDTGLVEDFASLASPSFDPTRVHPEIHRFYERTSEYDLEAWNHSPFPGRLLLWLLVNTVSRAMQQLEFPVTGLDLARGLVSQVLPLRDAQGRRVCTAWIRRRRAAPGARDRVVYTGFYGDGVAPLHALPCVRVVFPLPRGNATVLLAPSVDPRGGDPSRGGAGLILSSAGRGFGDVGFYRVVERSPTGWRVLRLRTLHEHFALAVDDDGEIRCDHRVTVLGITAMQMHYKITRRPAAHGAVHAERREGDHGSAGAVHDS